jgi:hypothetical protein
MLDTSDQRSEYAPLIISYLISVSENDYVLGFSTLAERLYYLQKELEKDDEIDDSWIDPISDLVSKRDDKALDWEGLREYMMDPSSESQRELFFSVVAEDIGENRWKYRLNSEAPQHVLEDFLKENMSEYSFQQLEQHVSRVGQMDETELMDKIYS